MNTYMALSELGEVNAGPQKDDLCGQVRYFETWNLNATGPLKPQLHGGIIEAVRVKNESGGALTQGEIVTWNTDSLGPGRSVEGETSAATTAAGVVPWLVPSAGVADGEYFWLIRRGYCKFLSDGGNDVSAGGLVQPAASGRVSAHTAGTNDIYACGRMIEAIGSSAGALKEAIADFRF